MEKKQVRKTRPYSGTWVQMHFGRHGDGKFDFQGATFRDSGEPNERGDLFGGTYHFLFNLRLGFGKGLFFFPRLY